MPVFAIIKAVAYLLLNIVQVASLVASSAHVVRRARNFA